MENDKVEYEHCKVDYADYKLTISNDICGKSVFVGKRGLRKIANNMEKLDGLKDSEYEEVFNDGNRCLYMAKEDMFLICLFGPPVFRVKVYEYGKTSDEICQYVKERVLAYANE